MWIMTNLGFVSIVHKAPCKPDQLLVRARAREHLVALFPDRDITESDGTDYRFRLVVSRDDVAVVIATLAQDIDYSNFKGAVKDRPYHDALVRVWAAMASLQPFGAYGNRCGRGLFADERGVAPPKRAIRAARASK